MTLVATLHPYRALQGLAKCQLRRSAGIKCQMEIWELINSCIFLQRKCSRSSSHTVNGNGTIGLVDWIAINWSLPLPTNCRIEAEEEVACSLQCGKDPRAWSESPDPFRLAINGYSSLSVVSRVSSFNPRNSQFVHLYKNCVSDSWHSDLFPDLNAFDELQPSLAWPHQVYTSTESLNHCLCVSKIWLTSWPHVHWKLHESKRIRIQTDSFFQLPLIRCLAWQSEEGNCMQQSSRILLHPAITGPFKTVGVL